MTYREYNDFLMLIKQKDLEGIRKCISDQSYDLNSPPMGNAALPLCYAVRLGKIETVKLLLEFGADPDLNFENSLSPLMESAKLSDIKCKIMNLLLEKGANVNKTLQHQDTALHVAVRNRNLEALKTLLKNGADSSIGMADPAYGVPGKNLYTPLYQAVLNGHREIILALLEAGADTNIGIASEKWSQNLLVRAVYNNKKWLAELLIKYGASVYAAYLSNSQKAALTTLLAKNIHSDPLDIEKNKDYIEILDLRGLPIKEIPVGIDQLSKCRALYLGGNLFKKLDLKEIATQKLEYLSLQNAVLSEISSADSLNTLANLKVMDLRGNKLKKSAFIELGILFPNCIIIENDAELDKLTSLVRPILP